MEAEWQPARITWAHDRGENRQEFAQLNTKELPKKVVRVKPWEFLERQVALYRSIGCDAQKFYIIHPEDAAAIWQTDGCSMQVCEHEILTD